MLPRIALFLGLALASLGAVAASSEVLLDVKGMTCSTCPITVRAVLKKLDGVEDAKVDAVRHTAIVKFDPARVSSDRIAKALTEAGFPATPLK